MKNKIIVLVTCLCAALCISTPAYGQNLWEKKPYQQWTVKEALKILTNSP